MTSFIDIEEQLKQTEHLVIPGDMRDRIVQRIRNADASSVQAGRRKRSHLTQWMTGAAAVVVAGAVSIGIVHHSAGVSSPVDAHRTPAAQPSGNDLAMKVDVATKSVHTGNMDVLYPQLSGLSDANIQRTINETLTQLSMPADVAQVASGGHFESSYQVSYQRGNLIDLIITTQNTPQMSADGGQTIQKSVIFDLATGKEFGMADLFQSNNNYLHQLSRLVQQNDTQRILGLGMPFPQVKASDVFALTNDGFAVIFQQNEWTAHSSGTPAFRMKFSDVSGYVNTTGALWKAIEAAQSSPENAQSAKDIQYIDGQGYRLALTTPGQSQLSAYEAVLVPSESTEPIYVFVGESKKDPMVEKVFFFKGAKFLGTGTKMPDSWVANVYPEGGSKVEVAYQNQNSGVSSNVQYAWDGKQMVPR